MPKRIYGFKYCKIAVTFSNSLAGVLHRSKEGDSVMVGRKEYPFEEVLEFTTKNWKSFNIMKSVLSLTL